jgi:hypothetical protein
MIKNTNVQFEYATLEWLWDSNSIRINLPNEEEVKAQVSYKEIVNILNDLGQNKWQVVSNVAGGNWLFWTLMRRI